MKDSHHLFIGIDPGQSGALALIDETSIEIMLRDWPGDEIAASAIVREIVEKAEHYGCQVTGAIEYVHSMPKQGVVGVFKFGANYGIWRGILSMAAIPFFLVRPQQWQKEIVKRAEGKKASVAAASRLFPGSELYGPRGGTKDGRADALLIAYWCRCQMVKE